MDRALSLADDVEIIREDALKAVEDAEDIAPPARRPRKSLRYGPEREVSLGSLREGETLPSSQETSHRDPHLVESRGHHPRSNAHWMERKGMASLIFVKCLAEAKGKTESRTPKEAFEFAVAILPQLEADAGALERAETALSKQNDLKQADGSGHGPT